MYFLNKIRLCKNKKEKKRNLPNERPCVFGQGTLNTPIFTPLPWKLGTIVDLAFKASVFVQVLFIFGKSRDSVRKKSLLFVLFYSENVLTILKGKRNANGV